MRRPNGQGLPHERRAFRNCHTSSLRSLTRISKNPYCRTTYLEPSGCVFSKSGSYPSGRIDAYGDWCAAYGP